MWIKYIQFKHRILCTFDTVTITRLNMTYPVGLSPCNQLITKDNSYLSTDKASLYNNYYNTSNYLTINILINIINCIAVDE